MCVFLYTMSCFNYRLCFFFFFQAEDGIRDYKVTSSDECSSDLTALPNAAPAIASSEIGVSNTRSGPCFSIKPLVTANTPPAAATSSPKKMTLSSRASSSSRASQIASRNSSSAILELPDLPRLGEWRVRRGLHQRVHLLLHRLVDLVELLGRHPVAVAEARARDDQRVALAPLVELTWRAI